MSANGAPGPRDDAAERPPPRGCNPLVFGVVLATLELGVLLWLMYC